MSHHDPLPPLQPGQSRRVNRRRRLSLLLLVAGTSSLLAACNYPLLPISPLERTDILSEDRGSLFQQQEPVSHPISLFEAMARALKYNLTHRVALMEKAVAQRQLELGRFDLLPQIAASTELRARSNPDAAKGFSLTDQISSGSYSTSQDQVKESAKLTATWNLLDFGISAIQAEQEADRTHISTENQRKAVHALLQDVRSTYWKAAGAQKLENAIGPIIQQARQALMDARKVEQERLKPQVEILRYQKTLLEIVKQMQDLRHQLSLAKTEFAALINLPPGSSFQLAIPDDPVLTIPEIRLSLDELEALALDNRPDLREAMYQVRIGRADVRKAMLRLLPGLEFQIGHNWDSNSYTLNSQWEEAGTRVVWNILNLLQGPTAIRLAENKEELARLRRLTLHMAIISQVHLAYRQYLSDQRRLLAVEELDAVEQRLFTNYGVSAHNDAQSRLEYITAAASALMIRLQLFQAYADAQNSLGRIFGTLGVDLSSEASRHEDLAQLTETVRSSLNNWNEGISLAPLHQVEESLAQSATHSRRKKMRSAAPPEAEKAAIPDYFLDPQFMDEESLDKQYAPEQAPPVAHKPAPAAEPLSKAATAPASTAPAAAPATPATPAAPASAAPATPAAAPAATATSAATMAAAATASASAASAPAASSHAARSNTDKEAANNKKVSGPEKGKEPPKIEHPPTTAQTPANTQEPPGEIITLLRQWAKAWSQRIPEHYWSFYAGEKFQPFLQPSLEAWKQRTRETLHNLSFLQVDVDQIQMVREIPAPLATLLQKGSIDYRQITFRESYRSNHLQNFSRKLMILGKEADGWKIFREAPLPPAIPGSKQPAGFAIQVAAMEGADNGRRLAEEWQKRGFAAQAIAALDERKRPIHSVRLAHMRNREQAIFYRWLLMLATGVESVIVPAEAEHLQGVAEVAPTAPPPEKEKPLVAPKSPGNTPAKKDVKNVVEKKANKSDSEEPEGDR
ncbi:TolC family protein [Candidatus Magnetaquicoccus inordinatus]|uniref:TolC family protein n=1 Tax=Candidatus Magnetaquicoccus inordinatus TaxID=2496818 RepID=UPI00187D4562|nr:TolC family protein [Candidatus Magnetaquicoccus inordinatus]